MKKRTLTLLVTAALLMGALLPEHVRAAAYEFRTGAQGKDYWYENGVKQGTVQDTQGILGDGTNRGREIYDPATDAWYWLDSCFDGAKAAGKEVWVPYVYQEELTQSPDGMGRIAKGISDETEIRNLASDSINEEADMSAQVEDAIRNHTGKWVRYDEKGRMLKGWVKITGALAECYPNQVNNLYYYDQKTGLMAKGYVTINGIQYHFDEETGVCDNYRDPVQIVAGLVYHPELTAEEAEAQKKILALKDEYYEGRPWTNSNTYQTRASNYPMIGGGCAGFAFIASDTVFGDAPVYYLDDFNKVRVGDILRINNNSHSVVALDFDETGITITEGNYNSSIHWGRKLPWSTLEERCDYILSRYPSEWNGTHRPDAKQMEAATIAAITNNPGDALDLINQARKECGVNALTMNEEYKKDSQACAKQLSMGMNPDVYPDAGELWASYDGATAQELVNKLKEDYVQNYDPSESLWGRLMDGDITQIGIGYTRTAGDTPRHYWVLAFD